MRPSIPFGYSVDTICKNFTELLGHLLLHFIFRDIGTLDTLESFELGSDKLHNFVLHDRVHEDMDNEWKFRLPWPLFDVTTVKIPVKDSNKK